MQKVWIVCMDGLNIKPLLAYIYGRSNIRCSIHYDFFEKIVFFFTRDQRIFLIVCLICLSHWLLILHVSHIVRPEFRELLCLTFLIILPEFIKSWRSQWERCLLFFFHRRDRIMSRLVICYYHQHTP